MRNKSNSIHPNTWKPYFQKLLNFQKMNEDNLTTTQKLPNIENDMKTKQDFLILPLIWMI